MSRGGYRKPANPAPVSGPGKLSRRTDGKQPVMPISGGKYGENKAINDLQSQAPMYQQGAEQMPKVTNLFAPTARASEPVTAGMPFGDGPNSISSDTAYQKPNLAQTLMTALQYSDDPDLEQIYNILQGRGEI